MAIVLFVLLRYTDSDYPFGIFKLFLQNVELHCHFPILDTIFVSPGGLRFPQQYTVKGKGLEPEGLLYLRTSSVYRYIFFFKSNLFNDYDINSIGVLFGLGIIRFYGVTNNRVQ
jgi:hypothetical protein